ncbi:hypothetical protein TIFTF001_006292 [Ficus carica]|uniref:Uncharacterized protein n=1 Tax=Ficus carica TaxID=3494 RepID=A0AA88DFJ0_FICCA|nr:hypothetical protein TIFTF001_006292 [Ficus carica]
MAKSIRFSCYLFTFSLSLVIPITKCYDHPWLLKKKSALFIFGDSAFDAGNNNYINTSFQADYFPYDETFFKFPTGRFSDGRLVPDFIVFSTAEYANLPLIPPYYLQLSKQDFTYYGVNFASAGAGALVETRQGSAELGDTEAGDLLAKAVYLFSVGGNDYAFAFETNSSVVRSSSPEQLVGLVIGNITSVIQVSRKVWWHAVEVAHTEEFSAVEEGEE